MTTDTERIGRIGRLVWDWRGDGMEVGVDWRMERTGMTVMRTLA